MSLRAFHIVFIVCSIVLAAWFAFWEYQNYQVTQASFDLMTGVASAIASLGLVIYLFWFLKKIQQAGK